MRSIYAHLYDDPRRALCQLDWNVVAFDKFNQRLDGKTVDRFGLFVTGYRSGYNKHREMLTKHIGHGVETQTYKDAANLQRLVSRAIIWAMKAHPELQGRELASSISKRIIMQIKDTHNGSYQNVGEK